MSELLVCPICKNNFVKNENILRCENCGTQCVISGEIYDLMGNKEDYWGEIPLKEMEETNELAKIEGWRTAVKRIGLKHPDLITYILSNARADWLFHCINYSRTKSCLDVGSGMGANTFILANFFEEVWSLEAVKQRIEFQQIRKYQDKINNIKFVRADWLHLPFPDNYFDLVAVNGVLEWIGLSDYSRNPRELQKDFLNETRRVLKPGGCLYIGIENRFSVSSFLGAIDHSGLPFTNLLPRKIADLVVRYSGKAGIYRQYLPTSKWPDYRTYTYSMSGYKKLLKASKYDQVDFFWSFSYNMPNRAGRFDDGSFPFYLNLSSKSNTFQNIRSFLTLIISTFSPSKLSELANRLLCPSFLIFAFKGNRSSSFETKLINSELPNAPFLRISGGHGMDSKIIYFVLKGGKPISVLKFPRGKGSKLLGMEEAKITQFNRIDIRKRVIDSVPIFIEPMLRGVHPQPYNKTHNQKVLTWLLKFQNITQKGSWDHVKLKMKIENLCDILTVTGIDREVQMRTKERVQAFLNSLVLVDLPIVSEHGDFCQMNIIINENDIYVIDWEFYDENGDILFDFIFYLLDIATSGAMPESFRNSLLCKGKYWPTIELLILEFSQKSNIQPELIIKAIPYVILRCINRIYSGSNNRHLNIYHFSQMLKIWDEICIDSTNLILSRLRTHRRHIIPIQKHRFEA